MIIRDLLTSHGMEIKPFPQGQDQVAHAAAGPRQPQREAGADGGGSISSGWSITVTGEDIMKSQIVTKTSKIVDHACSERRHMVTLDPDLVWNLKWAPRKPLSALPRGQEARKWRLS
jgi:hypothetical protein